jgi:hypothetical protein
MATMKLHQYTQISNNLENANWEGNPESNTHDEIQSYLSCSRVMAILPWLLAGVFGTFSAVLWTKCPCTSPLGCYENGFKTDFRNFGKLYSTIIAVKNKWLST